MKHILALLTSIVLLICSIGFLGAPGAVHATSVSITIWHNWTNPNLANIESVLNQYEVDHPTVTITLYQPTDFLAELAVAIPAGTGPDIIVWGNDMIGNFKANGYIIDLDQLVVTPGWLGSTYEPAAVAAVKYKDKIWGIPFLQESIALIYNTALVNASDLPTDPLDFATLLSKAQAFKTATGKPLICNQGFPGGDAYHIAPVFFGYGIPSYIDEHGIIYVNQNEAVAAGEWLLQMKPLTPSGQTYDQCKDGLLAGNIGAWWTGPWAIAAIEEGGISYEIAAMGAPFVGIPTMMVSTNALTRGNAAIALDISKYLTNTANSITLSLQNKTVPANSAALADPSVQALKTVSGFGEAAKTGVPMSPSPNSACQWGPIGDAITAMWSLAKTPRVALNIAFKQIQACAFSRSLFLPVITR